MTCPYHSLFHVQDIMVQCFGRQFHPCCGFFLQGGVKVVAIFQILICVIMTILTAIATVLMVFFLPPLADESDHATKMQRKVPLVTGGLSLTIHLPVLFVMGLILYRAAHTRDWGRCRLYVLCMVPNYCLGVTTVILYFYFCNPPLDQYGAWLVSAVFQPYAIFVVLSFMRELTSVGDFNKVIRHLTDAEVQDFFQQDEHNNTYAYSSSKPPPVGKRDTAGAMKDDKEPESGVMSSPNYNPEFEIPLETLVFGAPLGSGQFGQVLRATWKRPCGGEDDIVVAVKTTKANAHPFYVKSLLQELKVMSCIGQHANIVNLLGACTTHIKERKVKGKVYIVVEYCPFGSLLDFLHTNRGLFVNLLTRKATYGNLEKKDTFDTGHLIRWCSQLAHGLSFLHSKLVVHGDVAARNVLLAQDRRVKIVDFGLSMELYQNSSYMKKSKQPLPWRWMAIESLEKMHFSTATDIWSYGVTVWEVFTLGQVPYPGLGWTSGFIHTLKQGLRMKKPANAPDQTYEILEKCWETEPAKRPNASGLCSLWTQIQMSDLIMT